jgi:hypothetical protein
VAARDFYAANAEAGSSGEAAVVAAWLKQHNVPGERE